ncbi:hypothetical protein TorRG33x02_205750, partial [Trema orientale]
FPFQRAFYNTTPTLTFTLARPPHGHDPIRVSSPLGDGMSRVANQHSQQRCRRL